MKINVPVTELIDGKIDWISLVKHGANRSPWKIMKSEEQEPSWLAQMPELQKLKQRLDAPVRKETKTVKLKNAAGAFAKTEHDQPAEAAQIRKREIAKLRHRLNGLNLQINSLWEQPTHPLYNKLEADLNFRINKTELELATLTVALQENQIDRSSAFFFRGGRSQTLQADVSDSAYAHQSAMRKAESQIDLSPTITTTDETEVSKIDLGGMKL